MKGIVKEAAKELSHAVFRVRNFQNRCIKDFAKDIRNKTILELGSGEAVDGKFIYSDKNKFHPSNTFIRSDVSPEFGHLVVNVETMDYEEEYDIILCLNVLEHVYDFQTAIKNIYKALKPGGILVLSTPYTYPLHMIPMDYWRFSAFALRKMLVDFSHIELKRGGIKFLPSAYFVTAQK
jgi:SAM-dependent methyltransferase